MDAYDERESELFIKQIRAVESQSLIDRREAREALKETLENWPQHFIQSINWLVEGAYGFGAFKRCEEVIKNTRMNRNAWLFITTAAIDYHVCNRDARKVWKELGGELQKQLNEAIDGIIEAAREE